MVICDLNLSGGKELHKSFSSTRLGSHSRSDSATFLVDGGSELLLKQGVQRPTGERMLRWKLNVSAAELMSNVAIPVLGPLRFTIRGEGRNRRIRSPVSDNSEIE